MSEADKEGEIRIIDIYFSQERYMKEKEEIEARLALEKPPEQQGRRSRK